MGGSDTTTAIIPSMMTCVYAKGSIVRYCTTLNLNTEMVWPLLPYRYMGRYPAVQEWVVAKHGLVLGWILDVCGNTTVNLKTPSILHMFLLLLEVL